MTSEFISHLFSLLWQDYINRVSYARIYQQMIINAGGNIANDHIAFRSLRLAVDSQAGKINLGIDYLGQIFASLGYVVSGEYDFAKTHLYARHYSHPQQEELDLPKLFISELIVDKLPDNIQEVIQQTVTNSSSFHQFNEFNELELNQLSQIFTRPWKPPFCSVIEKVNKVTQYGAWVLLHGYAVNHFTGYVNHQQTSKYPDIDSTAAGLANLGVPMKAEIEGDMSCGLRQTATQAVTEFVTAIDDKTDAEINIPWTYAYYEIAQRYLVEVAPGKHQLFDGFLGKNAQKLFEMTHLSRVC